LLPIRSNSPFKQSIINQENLIRICTGLQDLSTRKASKLLWPRFGRQMDSYKYATDATAPLVFS
jgi:hypothetical protein